MEHVKSVRAPSELAETMPLSTTHPAADLAPSAPLSRQARVKAALFRGETLRLGNPDYFKAVRALLTELLRMDAEPADLTAGALGLENRRGRVRLIAREPGIVAGLEEAAWLYSSNGLKAALLKPDGAIVAAGEALLQIEGDARSLLRLERTCLNLVQRMSGIATAARRLQELVHSRSPETCLVATRKTPWGLLDKRAVHLGGGGTHRLGLWDAILLKNNHLRFFSDDEEEAVVAALKRVWPARGHAAFVEVEVTSLAGALAAGRTVRVLQQSASEACPCFLMLDNLKPGEVRPILAALRQDNLWGRVFIEVSGKIQESELESFAACGVDAISIGALTHSCRVLDLHAKTESLGL
jgi:nicotinate-nucleotide pyrophosphorylase (carboxylating)